MGLTRFPHGISTFGMPVLGSGGHMTTGNVYFVHYTDGTDAATYGTDPESPFKTLDYAIGQCTASNGDTIFCMEGHAETVTAAVALDVIGLTIIGLGAGDKRPTITVNAEIPGLNITAANQRIYNLRIIAGSSVTAATRLCRVATDNVEVINCRFEMAYDMYHMIVCKSGDDIKFLDCELINSVTTSADVHPQTAILNILATNVLVEGCRITDTAAKKAERWRTCIESGGVGAGTAATDNSNTTIQGCTFVCRGVATATRTAGASALQYTIDCRGISPSSNTAVGSIFTPTYQYIIETYNVAAVNKVGVVTVTTSDRRMKREIVYLKAA